MNKKKVVYNGQEVKTTCAFTKIYKKKSISFLFSGNRDMARERCHGNLHAPNKTIPGRRFTLSVADLL